MSNELNFRYSLHLEVMEFTSVVIENRPRNFTYKIWFKILLLVFALLVLVSLVFSSVSMFYLGTLFKNSINSTLSSHSEQCVFNSSAVVVPPISFTGKNYTNHTNFSSSTQRPIWNRV